MEIASPLPPSALNRNEGGSVKRPFSYGSPHGAFITDPSSVVSVGEPEQHLHHQQQQPFKRRRFHNNSLINESSHQGSSSGAFPGFAMATGTGPVTLSPFGSNIANTCAPSSKRARINEHGSYNSNDNNNSLVQIQQQQKDLIKHQEKAIADLQRIVQEQSSEISRIQSEKQNAKGEIAATMENFRAQYEKILGENKILKRAVAIQQERQNQAASEIEAACKYRKEAEERIKRLEQMNMTLQFHLQQQTAPIRNDFMGFSPRPPDIY